MPVEYYLKLPDQLYERLCIVVDPMLATGNSAVAAVQRIKMLVPSVSNLCLLAAPEGLTAFRTASRCAIVTAAVVRELNDHTYPAGPAMQAIDVRHKIDR